MSSLAASRADNFYYPPEWRPEYGSISKYQGSKGKNQYETHGIIRFELPFDAWCEGCNRHLGKGVRFNAKKEAAGQYFSTKIWAFHMTCPSCSHKFVIRTDPKNRDYEFVSGLRKKIETYSAEDSGTIEVDGSGARAIIDPISKLEKDETDRVKAKANRDSLELLLEQKERVADDFAANRALRKIHRVKRNEHKKLKAEARARGLHIALLPEDDNDARVAKRVFEHAKPNSGSNRFRVESRMKRAKIGAESVFANAQAHPTDTTAPIAAQKAAITGIRPKDFKLHADSMEKLKQPVEVRVRPKPRANTRVQTSTSAIALVGSYGSDDDQR